MQQEKTPGSEPNAPAQATAALDSENQAGPDGGLPAAPCSALSAGSTTEDVMDWISSRLGQAGLKRTH